MENGKVNKQTKNFNFPKQTNKQTNKQNVRYFPSRELLKQMCYIFNGMNAVWLAVPRKGWDKI